MKNKTLTLLIMSSIAIFISSMSLIRDMNMQDAEKPAGDNAINGQQTTRTTYYDGMICLKLKAGFGDYSSMEGTVVTGIRDLDHLLSKYNVGLLKKRFKYDPAQLKEGMPDLSRIYTITFPKKYPVNKAVREFSALKETEYAEAIPRIYKCETPNDALYGNQYHLPLIQAPAAWDIHKGENGPEVLIGIADDAIDWRHQDLIDNVWENLGEDFDGDGHVIEFNGTDWIFDPDDVNGIDDDGNGKVDDFVGWDYYNQDGEEDNDPTPELIAIDHGTHCIGCANSRTNNTLDCAATAWNVKFVGAKLSNQGGQYFDASAMDASIYLAELGADILTCSWTGGSGIANREAIEYIQSLGCLVVAAAGNDNNEILNYPASFPGVVSVAATSQWDAKASFSSYGVGIDICAPGVNVLSLKPFDNTQTMSGTSMAAPVAAGYFALMKSYYQGWSNEQIIEQVLATADDIDSLNGANLANKLGYGRINVYRGLTETNASTRQELKLHFIDQHFTDADTNGLIEPGEEVNMGFKMTNFSVGIDAPVATFILSTTSPYIHMVKDTITSDLPCDNTFSIDSAFLFEVDPGLDSTKLITFTLTATSSLPIPLENEWEIELIVNQQGILVYNGQGSGSAYSGPFIRDFFANEGIPVFYTDVMPPGLIGFDVAFLSFGNYGFSLSNGTKFSQETSEKIAEYLYQGGFLYEDCGSFFGLMEYYGYSNLEEMEELFGIDTVITPLTYNSIELLSGLNNSLGAGLQYTHSTQSPNYYIDIMEPDSNGTAMFEEDDYGTVAVQAEGEYGQRTVCLSYSIAHLQDDSLSTNELLLARIAEFFGLLSVSVEEPEALINTEVSIYPNPAGDYCIIAYHANRTCDANILVYDMQGKHVFTRHQSRFDAGYGEYRLQTNTLAAGAYILCIQAGDFALSKKLLKR